MNKKAYISPVVSVTRVVTHYHLCIGSTNSDKPADGLGEDEKLTPGDNPGNFSRRGRDVWEDEEEEDDNKW